MNHFGDCVEGHNMHARVSAAITAWRLEVTRQREQLIQLAADCRLAGQRLDQGDADSAAGIQV